MLGKFLPFSTSLTHASAVKQSTFPLRRRRWRWVAAVCTVLAFIFFYHYIYFLLAVVYNYLWWPLFSSTVHVLPSATDGFDTSSAPALVPKIIHQTWRNESVPEKWAHASNACVQLHPGWQYMLWTDLQAEQLIATKYPWFLETYRSYRYNIQRADALRYFVLHHHGGIYIDLDIKCLKSLDFMRYSNFTAPKTYPIGLSNDILASRPGDPFALRLVQNLKAFDRFFLVKYLTVMFSTGPMFVTVQYTLHHRKSEVSVLPAQVYGKYAKGGPDVALLHLHGSSWHGDDAKMVFWLEAYWLQLLVVGAFLVGGLAGWLHGRYVGHRYSSGGGVGLGRVVLSPREHKARHMDEP